ncbi:MAG: biosynthetic peptidoglycan transglycosylase, partial [Acidobacteriota bacterium]
MEYDPLPSSKPSREDSDTPSEARPADGAQGEAASSQAAPPHIDPLSSGAVAPAAPQLSARQSDEDPPDPGRRWRRLRAWVIYPAVTAMLAAAAGIGVAASIRRPEVAELGSYVPLLVTQVKDRYGEVVRTYSRENRIMLREGEVPLMLQNAIVATEDANFFNHGGVDLKGVARAAVTNLRAGRIREGASTITMQLSRGLFSLTREQKWWRKV